MLYNEEQIEIIFNLKNEFPQTYITLSHPTVKKPVNVDGSNHVTGKQQPPSLADILQWMDAGKPVGCVPKSLGCIVLDSDTLDFDDVAELVKELEPHAVTRSLSNVQKGQKHKVHLWFRVSDEDGASFGNGPWNWKDRDAGELRYDNHVVMAEPTEAWARLVNAEEIDAGKLLALKGKSGRSKAASQAKPCSGRQNRRPAEKHLEGAGGADQQHNLA